MDLTNLLLSKYKSRPREIGKFHVSDVWAINNGYLKTEEFLTGKENKLPDCFNMWQGVGKHRQIQELFEGLEEYEIEKRAEYQPKEYKWYLVGKADLLTKDEVIEIKTSKNLLDKAKRWHIDQVKIYCSIFDRPKGLIVQPIIKPKSIELKEIGVVKRDEKWFLKEMAKLNEFYDKISKKM